MVSEEKPKVTAKALLKTIKKTQPKKPRERSPNYPFIGLEKSLLRTKELYESALTHFIPITVAHGKWGIKPLGAIGNQTSGALKSFGLIEIQGEGEKRQVRVSEAARRILLNSQDCQQLLQSAALSPLIHAELWDKYGQGGLPSDEIIRSYLVVERGFNKDSVDGFIAQFRETLAFAKITKADKIEVVVQEEYIPKDEVTQILQSEIQSPQKPPIQDIPSSPAQGYSDFPLYLSNNRKGTLRLPTIQDIKDYELLKSQIDNSLAVLKAIAGIVENSKE